VNDPPPGAVDDVHAFLHLLQALPVDQVLGVRRQGGVEGDEVGLGPDFLQVALLDAQLLEGG